MMANCLKQMRLTKTAAAINEERIVGAGGGMSHSLRGGMGKLVIGTDNKTLKCVGGIHSRGRGACNHRGLHSLPHPSDAF